MKNKIIYLGIALCMILGFAACSENANWVIVEDVQPGVYVSGSAVVYKSVAPAASFKAAPVDPDTDTRTGVTSMFTWLKASGDLLITKSDESGNVTTFGKGDAVSPITSSLVENGSAFKVTEDGLYFLVYNSELNQLTIIPAKFGIIGAATEGGWSKETPFKEVKYNEHSGTVEFTGSFPLSKDQLKFRFNGDWGIELPYDATSKIKLHTNLGSIDAADGNVKLNTGSAELKGGGKNLASEANANYTITLKLDLRTGKFYASAEEGDPIVTPEFPEKLYMIGKDFGDWTWTNPGVVEMNPVNGVKGAFWCINYFSASNGFKWAPGKEWKGDFAQQGDVIGYTVKDGNAFVSKDGLYMVYIDMEKQKIAIEDAKVYGIGDAFGAWDEGKYPFTVSGSKATITIAKDANLRMYAASSIKTTDWWTREFNIFDGSIVYRGNGGDQAAVPVKAGQVVTLDFKTGTGTIK